MKNIFFLSISMISLSLFVSCNKNERYNCMNGNCIESKNGKFRSLSECEEFCIPTADPVIFNPDLVYGEVSDVEGNVYKTISINGELWMAEDLKTSRYSNGDTINHVIDEYEWSVSAEGAWCYFANDVNNGVTKSKLYNWHAVNDSRNICPEGWHVPTLSEYEELESYLDTIKPINEAGNKMKSTGTLNLGSGYWADPNEGASNYSGFSGLPNGLRNREGSFVRIGLTHPGGSGSWWTSTDINSFGNLNGFSILLTTHNKTLIYQDRRQTSGQCVRCKQDN
ncbi:fibrobacter succinogenes major paralogous domain-containing protein [Brumimicrobium oceani]|uniref:Fibrobacter succinogenes major paralogous domain-containing protein n=1 Tax=Brumimicrobium oceani TaxID=2100725 RepID=A0A2U2XAT6_9FLAO|nr:fibrobacter succinogenes major paralogous domain-containing protein [Brumimicrobium oceani]PWH84915.1 hypothetical protein DIT68_12285 [Brumimicrobium oceani]